MKNGLGDVLYVGISTQSIWERWFGFGGHIIWIENGKLFGTSSVGQKIEDHLPDSLNWKIQLWTLEDCIKFCENELPPNIQHWTIKWVESFMIQKLSPILNVSYNLHPGKDTTPKSKKEIEREKLVEKLYREIFEKK